LSTRAAPQSQIAVIVIFVMAAIACLPMLWYGASNGHSIVYNLVWLKNFSAQLAHGDLYPRWLMGMNHGAGSPAFYFYAPLPFYLASIPALIAPTAKLTVQLAWGEWLLIAFSGLTFFHYARRRYSVSVAWFCAVLYMLMPYHFEIDLWRRQDVGELANYIWMPLILYYTEKLFEGRRAFVGLAISYAMLMLSHLPSALLFSICVGFYAIVLLWARHSWRQLPRFVSAIAIGILLAGAYWVPAMFSEQYVRSEKLWTPYFDYHHWFFPMNEAPHHDAGSHAFADRLFTLVGVSTAIFALCWLPAFRWRETVGTKKLIGCLVLIGIAWFLMSSWSTFIWENAPELWKVQFPWRIAMVVDLAAAIAALHALRCLQFHRDWFSAAALVISLAVLTWCFATADVKHKLDPFDNSWWITGRDNAVRNGLDAPEYTTKWNPSQFADTSTEIADQERLVYESKAGEIKILHWFPRKIVLQVNLQQPTLLQVHQFYFPNWRAKIESGDMLSVMPSKQNGLIAIDLPVGSYRADLSLLWLPQEWIGATLSAIGVIVLFVSTLWRRNARERLDQNSAKEFND
jgi:hypothetical protein